MRKIIYIWRKITTSAFDQFRFWIAIYRFLLKTFELGNKTFRFAFKTFIFGNKTFGEIIQNLNYKNPTLSNEKAGSCYSAMLIFRKPVRLAWIYKSFIRIFVKAPVAFIYPIYISIILITGIGIVFISRVFILIWSHQHSL